MMASAELGYFQLPDWNASNTAVHEYEVAEPYEDEEAERLLLCRTRARQVYCPAAVEESLTGDGTVVGEASSQIRARKRRFSTRVGEKCAGFGKAVKKRTHSWTSRKDSVAPLGLLTGARIDESSPDASSGSGESSRDGDNERSDENELISRERGTRLGHLHARRSAQSGPVSGWNVERAQHRQVLLAQPRILLAHNRKVVERQEEEMLTYDNPRRDVALIERRLRIAERQGQFSSAAREETFKESHRRLGSESSQQTLASIKLKTKPAKAKAKSDKRFRRWSEDRDESPVRRIFNKLWRRNGRGKEAMVESDPSSGLESSVEDSTFSATESSNSPWSEDEADRRQGDNVQAAAHAGRAVRQVASHTGMHFVMF